MPVVLPDLYSSVLGEAVVGDWGEGPAGEDWGKMSLSEDWVMPSHYDMHLEAAERGHLRTGLLDAEPLRESEEDNMVSDVDLNNTVTEEEREEIQQELAKLEEEISTLRQVLSSKEKQHAELKQKLGITPLSELRNNFSRSWYDMQTSTAYKKTSETFSTAGQKTSAAFNNLGSAISRKFGDMSIYGLELLYPRRYVPLVCGCVCVCVCMRVCFNVLVICMHVCVHPRVCFP
ncbi:tumor protein D53 isoform X8 [Osmerus eperlanus]|uniref:tumor protein D53 isoform X8 n=1 Tax=Osmerus eperlanus TaxID=29151 RepID=UPI002E14895B